MMSGLVMCKQSCLIRERFRISRQIADARVSNLPCLVQNDQLRAHQLIMAILVLRHAS